jgi:hypothetical protein
MTSPAPGGPASIQPIESYLAEIAAALPGPARTRADIVTELRGGLLDAADAHHHAGLDPPAAARAAVAEFGHGGPDRGRVPPPDRRHPGPPPRDHPAGHRPADRHGMGRRSPGQPPRRPRRPALAMGTHATRHPHRLPPDRGGLLDHDLDRAAHPGRHRAAHPMAPPPPPPRPTTAAIAGFGAATIDLALLALLASQLATAPAKLAAAPIALAAAASTTRIILARHAGQRCLASRAALP